MTKQSELLDVLVMGAGAVGGYFGAVVQKRTAASVWFIARGSHLEAMKTEGLAVKSSENAFHLAVNATENPKEAPEPDLVLFTVKSHDTETAIEQIKPVVGKQTQILTLQNGVENYQKLAEAFGSDQVVQGFCKVGASVTEPGVIRHAAFGEVTIGERNGRQSERTEKIKILFEQAQVPITVSRDIRHEIWLKFTWNCLLNMVTAAADVTVEKIFEVPEGEELCYHLLDEIQRVARKEGVTISDEEGISIIESARSLEGFETSTYQDRQKGKPMEFEAFTGAVLRMGSRHSLNLPYHKTLYAILRLVDIDNT